MSIIHSYHEIDCRFLVSKVLSVLLYSFLFISLMKNKESGSQTPFSGPRRGSNKVFRIRNVNIPHIAWTKPIIHGFNYMDRFKNKFTNMAKMWHWEWCHLGSKRWVSNNIWWIFFWFYDKIQNLSFSALKKLVTEVSLKKNCLKQKSGQFWDADLTKDFFWTEMQALFPESCWLVRAENRTIQSSYHYF